MAKAKGGIQTGNLTEPGRSNFVKLVKELAKEEPERTVIERLYARLRGNGIWGCCQDLLDAGTLAKLEKTLHPGKAKAEDSGRQ